MFDTEYFTKLLNETSDYIQNKDKHTEIEDIDEKIESNKLALRIISEEIEDDDIKEKVLKRLDNLYDTYEDIEIKQRDIKSNTYDDVEEDILKNTKVLKEKAKRLFDGLVFDKEILDKVSNKMTKNITDTSENIRKIGKNNPSLSVFTLFIYGVILFLLVYFIIRFF